ncbi:MAG: NAD(P)/FAD-dependent oxidoreductase, partial [Erysipelotrichaceae bacterium]|nr:NAD(P)/FAD-dependent oxidoreductase [Erysipelotrichaceae bacterium]
IRIKEKIDKKMYDLTLKNVALTCKAGKFEKTLFGDMEFLPGSITGPIVLSMSSLINRLEVEEMMLDLKPALDEEKLDKRLLREIETNPNKDVKYLLSVLLPAKFMDFFVDNTGTQTDIVLNSLTKEKRFKLLHDLKHLKLTYQGLESIDKGIVTSGGVDVDQIDPKTMESKICKDLYFIGEVLDVDALTGGFNLQIALSTGYSCAMNIND